ncbi:MFS general substrate transporter, partial [Violaceomyces palustris]
DGGKRAWMVVGGCTTFFFYTLGLVYSFGIIQDRLIDRGLATASTMGWLSSVTVVLTPILAIPCTKFIDSFGNRLSGLLGAMLVGTGYVSTSFSLKSLPMLFLSQAIFGCGYAFVFWSSNSLAAQYFTRRRALAIGIVYSGSGVGGAVMSILLSRLVERIGLEWGIRALGIMAYIILVPASYTLKPRWKSGKAAFRLALFKDYRFVLLMSGTAISTFPLFVPTFFLPTYATSAGLSSNVGAWLVSGYNLSSALGRLAFGFVADTSLGPVTTYMLVLFFMGLSILAIWTVANSLSVLLLFMAINGSCCGAMYSLQPPVNASVFGVQDLALSMSMITMSRALGTALGGPTAGYLLDAFGGPGSGTQAYRPALFIMGSLSIVSSMVIGSLR